MSWAGTLVPWLKALHVAGLMLWVAGLFALPVMLAWYDRPVGRADYRRIRHATHYTYTLAVTPAAVITVIAGTWLMLLREVYVPWFYLKLLFVALLVAVHAWLGHILVAVVETPGDHSPPPPMLPIGLLLVPVLAILLLVLAKPDLGGLSLPGWLTVPQGRQLPFDMPSR
jgi:protoporphyrinogen IX oxidase